VSKYKHLEELRDDIYTCVRTRCGFCIQECPTYNSGLFESFASRGKMLQAKGLLEGELELSQELADSVAMCAMCGYCQAKCALQTVDVFKAIRAELVEAGFTLEGNDVVKENIIKVGDPLGSGRQRKQDGDGEYVLYLGCAYRDRPTDVDRILKILSKLGINPTIDEESCCGNALYYTGYKGAFEESKKRFQEVYKAHLNKKIITICPSCQLTLHDFFGMENVVFATDIILENIGKLKIEKNGDKVTFHDPCHLGRGCGDYDKPREIIERLGFDLVEMRLNREFSQCCGGGGGLQATSQEVVKDSADRRVQSALDTGAKYISTICPTCEATLFRASLSVSKEEKKLGTGRRIKTKDIWQLIEMVMMD